MKTKELALTALFLAMGLVLHQITIGLVAGMKPDFVVTMLFVAFLLLRNRRLVLPAGLAAGIITALTTSMPGGQVPNIIDKLITAFFLPWGSFGCYKGMWLIMSWQLWWVLSVQ